MMLRILVVSSPDEYAEELRRIGIDSDCADIFTDKRDSLLVKITDLPLAAANILKQTALSFGADVAVHREVISGKVERSDAIFMGTRRQLKRVVLALSGQPFGLARLEQEVRSLLERFDTPPRDLRLPAGSISFSRPVVVGVLNVTPDSFSDGGEYLDPASACTRITGMLDEGADIVDVGAESTRPGSNPVSASEQISRLQPVFSHLKSTGCIWSLDTTRPEVAERGIQHGVSILNDTSGGRDPQLWELARQAGLAYVLMHIQSEPRTMQQNPTYQDFAAELYSFFASKITEITETGFVRENLIIDPGIGFGKRVEDNTCAIRRLAELRAFGLPILVGASRKSFLGKLLGLEVSDRLEPSLAVVVAAYLNGANLLRVHDVKQTRKAVDAIHFLAYRPGQGGERKDQC